jgi:hypothetical protein
MGSYNSQILGILINSYVKTRLFYFLSLYIATFMGEIPILNKDFLNKGVSTVHQSHGTNGDAVI